MTRDQLEELAKWHESYGRARLALSETEYGNWHMEAAAAIRSLLAQEPVAWRRFEAFDNETAGWELYHDPVDGDEPLYAAPVPAVDLEAFKAEAMRLADAMAQEHSQARAALAAHLDKLGGK